MSLLLFTLNVTLATSAEAIVPVIRCKGTKEN